MVQFYLPNCSSSEIILPKEESRHILKSHRKKVNERIKLFDGKGYIYEGIIESIVNNCVKVKIEKKTFVPEKEDKVILNFAVIKIDRFELMLEKVTELGVDFIVPVYFSRCVPIDEKKFLSKYDRFKKIIIETCKQSNRVYLPELCSLKNLVECFTNFEKEKEVFNIVGYKSQFSKPVLEVVNQIFSYKEKYPTKKFVYNLFVGPEGDFTDEEIKFFLQQKNVYFIFLSENILRSETAGIVLSEYFCQIKR